MTTLTNEGIIAQLGWSRQIIKDAIGVTPLYFRPPYGDIDNRVRAIAKAMNLTPVMWTITGTLAQPVAFDTTDFVVPSGQQSAAQAWNTFQSLLTAADAYGKGFIVLEHDLYYQQVDLAIGYFLPSAEARGYKIVPIYECAGQELVNAYLETRTTTDLPGGSSGTPGGSGSNNNGTNGGSSGGKDFALPMLDAAKVVASVVFAGALAIAASL